MNEEEASDGQTQTGNRAVLCGISLESPEIMGAREAAIPQDEVEEGAFEACMAGVRRRR